MLLMSLPGLQGRMLMRISETPFSFLETDCLSIFGDEEGRSIYRAADLVYSRLESEMDHECNEAIRNHLQMKLFPPMAYYKALLSAGYDKAKALDYVRREERRTAEKKKQSMAKMVKLPFAYSIYRLGVRKFMEKNFPKEGWKTEWIRCDGKEIHFNLHSCIYHDLCNKYGCPELCAVYCENDDISFSGLRPKIRFERNGTLGNGAGWCDFHFKKG